MSLERKGSFIINVSTQTLSKMLETNLPFGAKLAGINTIPFSDIVQLHIMHDDYPKQIEGTSVKIGLAYIEEDGQGNIKIVSIEDWPE